MHAASAIRWFDRPRKQGSFAAKRQGGGRKPGRIEAEAAFLLGEVPETPDIARVELREKPRSGGVGAGIGTLWRFFDRRRIPFKGSETVRGERSGVSLNQAANSLRRLNISSGGPSAVGAVAITGLPLTSASSNFGMHSFEVPHRRGDNLPAGVYNA